MFCRQLSGKRLLNGCKVSTKLHHRSYNTSHYILPVFNLSAYCPSDVIENYLHAMHDNIGFPYIFGICTLPILTKFLIRLPFETICTKQYEQIQASLPWINEDKFESLLTILQQKRNTPFEIWQNYINLSMKQFHAKFLNIFPTFIAFYIHLSSYIGIERMIFHENATKDIFEMLTNNYLSSTDPYFILPIINGFGLMFCYAFINKDKSANFVKRRRNVKLSVLFMPFSALFFSSAFHFYILSNMISIVLYQSLTIKNEKFQKIFGLLTNEEQYHLSNMEKISNLYIEWNKDNFKSDSFGVFTRSFQGEKITVLSQDINAVLSDKKIFIPSIPPKDYFRNIEDEIIYFDDEYDEFTQRIEEKHNVRYFENNKDQIYLEQQETLSLHDDTHDIKSIDTQKTHKLTE